MSSPDATAKLWHKKGLRIDDEFWCVSHSSWKTAHTHALEVIKIFMARKKKGWFHLSWAEKELQQSKKKWLIYEHLQGPPSKNITTIKFVKSSFCNSIQIRHQAGAAMLCSTGFLAMKVIIRDNNAVAHLEVCKKFAQPAVLFFQYGAKISALLVKYQRVANICLQTIYGPGSALLGTFKAKCMTLFGRQFNFLG